MNTRKIRINGMDIVILAVIAAALVLLLYIFVGGGEAETAEAEYVDIIYVMEFTGLDGQFQDMILTGDPVRDAVKRGEMGTVLEPPLVSPMKVAGFDNNTRQEVYQTVPGRYTMQVAIEAKASVSERGYTVGDQFIYVGGLYSLAFPDMKCNGYCVDLEIME